MLTLNEFLCNRVTVSSIEVVEFLLDKHELAEILSEKLLFQDFSAKDYLKYH